MPTTVPTGNDFPCDRSVLTVRRFLADAAAYALAESRAAGFPVTWGSAGPGCTGTVWEEFVPTTIRLAPPLGEHSYVSEDVDGSEPPAFTTGIKVVDRVRQCRRARIQQVAVRSYLAPPARHCEIGARAAYLRSSHHPLRLDSAPGVYGGLTTRERRRLAFVTLDDQVALAAVLVAQGRPVAAFSADGRWPCHPLVLEVARRVRCTIVRRGLDAIPEQARRRIRYVRYVPVPGAP